MNRESVKTGWADRIRQLTRDESELRYLRKIMGQCLHTPRKANALLETVVSFTGSPIACLDTDFTYIFVNQAYARACGKAIDTFYGIGHFTLCPDEDCRGRFEEVLQTGRPVFFEARPVQISSRPSDPPCYWNQGVLPIQDGNGEVEHLLLSCEDVTRQFNVEKAAARFRAAADHAGYGLAIIDFSGRLTYANHSLARFLDCNPDELLRTSLENWVADNDQPDLTEVLHQTCREGETCQREWQLCRRDGSVFPAYMALAPVNLADRGRPDFVVVTLLDISDIKQFQNQLLEAEKMAVFGRLATNVVHEASSPLQTAMITLSDLEKNNGSDERIAENLDILKESFEAIHRTITGLLDLYRPALVKRCQADVNGLVRKTVEQLGVLFKRNRIEVNLDLAAEISAIETSPHQLNHCLLNICTNAVEAITGEAGNVRTESAPTGEKGRISIRTRQEDKAVVVDIVDNGPGITEERVEVIFEPFFSHKQSGLGIGLTRCREIVEKDGGTVSARNRKEGGAQVTLRLPVNGGASYFTRPS